MKVTILSGSRFGGLLLLLFWLLPAPVWAQGPGPAFDRAATCGQPASGSFYVPVRLAVDAAGNAYVAGYFSGTVVFGSTILQTTGSIPPPQGGRDYDWFVAKLDPLGTPVWAVRGGAPAAPDEAQDLCLDGLGHVFVAGRAQDGAAFGSRSVNSPNGEARIAVARLDAATGAWQWVAHGGANRNRAYGVAADGAGHVFVTGTLGQRGRIADFGPLSINTISGSEDAFVARLDVASGTWQWVSLGGSPSGTVNAQALALDGAGGVFVCGNYASTSAPVQFTPAGAAGPVGLPAGGGVFVARLAAGTGAWAWARSGGGSGPSGTDLLRSVAVDAAGKVAASGYFRSAAPVFGSTMLTNRSGIDQFGLQMGNGLVVGLDAGTGAWRWAVSVSGPNNESCAGVALDGNGEAYVVGGFVGPTTFGVRTLTAASGYEAYVARLSAATGAWRWVAVAGGRGAKAGVSPVVAGGQLHVLGRYTGAVADFGPLTLAGSSTDSFGFVGRLANATGPLAARPAGGAGPALAVWPRPAGSGAWVSGPVPGTAVQVLDALGRSVGQGLMPAAGPLALPLPPGRAAGLYLVRAGERTARLLVE
ncbi:hypothetical protein [Hymenobacter antarcticus]|uniref:Por secretion system C-terminal sorting domain-containing protein n=1 Tax=Hymenobacter antarcticus TaxID=486270 RepID=A0ABP7QPY9_9BACT